MRQVTFPTLETDVYQLHQQIERLMGGREENPYLWMAEPIGDRMLAVTIRSERLPDSLAPHARELPSEFAAGEERRFSLVAQCAVRRGPRNARTAIDIDDDPRRLQWLERRAALSGFEVLSVEIASVSRIRVEKMGARHVADRTRFEGRLRITEPRRFAAALRGGIGHGKAFGRGVLDVD